MTERAAGPSDQPVSPGPHGDAAHRREAAAHIERGIERYAHGAFEDAVREFEAALAAHPGNLRAVECLAWAREVVAGRRTLTSGTYAALNEESLEAGEPEEPPPLDSSPAAPLAAADPLASEGEPRTGRTMLGMPSMGDGPPRSMRTSDQLEDVPDSVTREWSTLRTGQNLPQLDVPELSEDQIANLLDNDAGRGLTLSKKTPAPAAREEEADEVDRTNVRHAERERVVEMVADTDEDEEDERGTNVAKVASSPATDEPDEPVEEFEPSLTPLSRPADPMILDQTADEPSSMPTNPFVRQRLSEYASPMLTSAARVEDLPAAPVAVAVVAEASTTGLAGSLAGLEASLARGAMREALDLAERVEAAPGTRTPEEATSLMRSYEAMVGDLSAIPRFGKATPDLDSRSAFLLSRMDGSTSADDLLDVSGMPRNEALRLLARLVVTGVVTMRK